MPSKLPPIPEDAFDGDKQKADLKFDRCSHKQVKFINGTLRCKCGASWMGPNLHDLYKLLTS